MYDHWMSGNGIPPNINITNIAQAKNEGCGTGCGGCLGVAFGIVAITLFVGAGWLLGSWIAVAIFGAKEGSTAAVAVGWIFEIVYLLLLASIGWALWQNRQKIWGTKSEAGEESASPSQSGRTIVGETTFAHEASEGQPHAEPGVPLAPPPSAVPPTQNAPQAHDGTAPFCHQCGSPTRDDAKFCSACGTTL